MDGRLKPYSNYRPYTDEEIRDEQDEYFENDATKKAVPGLFKDRDDITAWIKDSKLELLDIDEINQLNNSDVSEILRYSVRTFLRASESSTSSSETVEIDCGKKSKGTIATVYPTTKTRQNEIACNAKLGLLFSFIIVLLVISKYNCVKFN